MAGELVFDFPSTGSINYLYATRSPQEIAGSVYITLQVTTTGPVFFNHLTDPANLCARRAAARPFFWSNGNGNGEFDRWWSYPIAFDLAPGATTLAVRLTPDSWLSLFGKMGNADAAAQSGFERAVKNVSRIGLTFGGGCYFGHGVNVQGGQAQFRIVSYRIEN